VKERHELMGASVASAARSHRLEAESVQRVVQAYRLAMEPRVAMIEDDHDPAYLHPGRTVLLLLQDVGPLGVEPLCAAALHESEDVELRVAIDSVRRELGGSVAKTISSLPLPGDERLLEDLVTLPEPHLLVALAERLDQLRHAHLRDDRAWWREIYEEAAAVWVPVAERTHPRLADRFRHWKRTFSRRLEKAEG
jgi:(p)ppGpp synthase/HD superfamily hydrolase